MRYCSLTSLSRGVNQGPRLSGGDVYDTLAYMAPELLQGHPSPASDQYALGMVVYEWLAGDLPTLHGSLTKIAGQTVLVLSPSTPQPGKLTTVAPEVEEVVLTALAQDPEKRFTSVQAFANALEQAYQLQLKDPAFVSSIAPAPLPGHRSAGQHPRSQVPVNPLPPSRLWSRTPPTARTSFKRPPASPQPRRATLPPQHRHRLLLILLLLLIVFSLTASIIFFTRGMHSPLPPYQSLVVANAPDGESIGISDGTFAFDTGRLDGELKREAASKLRAKDITGAELLWKQAIVSDSSDAEALIYLEDQRVFASGRSYITLVVGTVLTGAFADTGRDSLQGAYVAQKEYNDQCFKLPSCVPTLLLIANSGTGDSSTSGVGYASLVMEQIVHAARIDKTIVGVMGWPISSSSLYANTVLGRAGIPVVSPAASIALPTGAPQYFFSIAPSIERQGSVGAQYAEQTLHARKVALFVDPVDRYSESLSDAFSRHFTADGNTVVVTENYTTGKPDTVSARIVDALNHRPDLIYFAGHPNDVGALLTGLTPCGPSVCLQVLGGDALYELGGIPSNSRPDLYRLHFTAYAYPDEWDILAQSVQDQKPLLFTDYPQAFDPKGLHRGTGGIYGYSRADSGVILSYDAMQILLNASTDAFNAGKQNITPVDLQQALTQISGSQAWQGASGRISFRA